jgi:hypothetical protein
MKCKKKKKSVNKLYQTFIICPYKKNETEEHNLAMRKQSYCATIKMRNPQNY